MATRVDPDRVQPLQGLERNGALRALTPREASIVACLIDATVAPDQGPAGSEPLPPVAGTDAVAAFDELLARSPALNRAGMRALLYLLEVAPLANGFTKRLRRLSRDQRERYIERLQRGPFLRAYGPLRALLLLSYYGGDGLLRRFGYDPDALLARSRELRAREQRW